MNTVINNLLALDVGTKRVGIAIADLKSRTVEPLFSAKRSQNQALNKVLELIETRNIHRIVVGLPLSASGEKTAQCDDAEKFAHRLGRRSDVEIVFFDEFLSTQEALEKLGLKNPSPEERKKGNIDAVAASIFLKDYINRHLKKKS